MTRKTLWMMAVATCCGISALVSAQTIPPSTAIAVTSTPPSTTPQPVQIVCLGADQWQLMAPELLFHLLAVTGDAISRTNSSWRSVERRTSEAMRRVVGEVQGLRYVTLGTGFVLPQLPGSNRPPLVATNFHVAAGCPVEENVRQLAVIERTGESIKYVKLEHIGRVRAVADGKGIPDRDDPTTFRYKPLLPKAICDSASPDSACSVTEAALKYRELIRKRFVSLTDGEALAKSLLSTGKDPQKRLEVRGWAPDIALLEAKSELAAAPVVIAESSKVSELKKGQRLAFAGYPGAVKDGRAATGGASSNTALTESVFSTATFNVNFQQSNAEIPGLPREKEAKAEMMELSGAQALPGNSGGPVFDPDTGHVVGMMTSSLSSQGAPMGISYAVSANDLRRFVEGTEYAIPVAAKPTPIPVPTPPKPESWAERLKKLAGGDLAATENRGALLTILGVVLAALLAGVAYALFRRSHKPATPVVRNHTLPLRIATIRAVGGPLNGQTFRLPTPDRGTTVLSAGVDPGSNQIIFPQSAAGVSNQHCRFVYEPANATLYVEDLNSTNGTYVNKTRLKPNERRRLVPTDTISLARPDANIFSCSIE